MTIGRDACTGEYALNDSTGEKQFCDSHKPGVARPLMFLTLLLSAFSSVLLSTTAQSYALTAERQSAAQDVLRGTVTDSAGRPLENVIVRIEAISLGSRTNGRGQYQIASIGSGTHAVTARALGYEPATIAISFSGGERRGDFALRLARTVLDSVEVRAARSDPRMDEFNENRRLRLGHFITSEELRRQEGQRLSSIVSMIPGLGLVNGRANQAWILSKRYGGAGRCIPWDQRPTSCRQWSIHTVQRRDGAGHHMRLLRTSVPRRTEHEPRLSGRAIRRQLDPNASDRSNRVLCRSFPNTVPICPTELGVRRVRDAHQTTTQRVNKSKTGAALQRFGGLPEIVRERLDGFRDNEDYRDRFRL